MTEKISEEVIELFEIIGLKDISEDTINYLKRNELSDFQESISDVIQNITSNMKHIKKISSIFNTIIKNKKDEMFWSVLRQQNITPRHFEVLCLAIMQSSEENNIYEGINMYINLLMSETNVSLWNPTLFNPIYSILMSLVDIFEYGSSIDGETKEKVKKILVVLENVDKLVNDEFLSYIEEGQLIALAELFTKLLSIFKQEFDSFIVQVQEHGFSVLTKLVRFSQSLVFPYLVPWVLLSFASSSTSMTAKLKSIRDKILSFLETNIDMEDTEFFNFMKHLVVRAPERAHLRRSACDSVCSLLMHFSSKYLNSDTNKDNTSMLFIEYNNFIDFIVTCTRSSKFVVRLFSVQTFVQICANIERYYKDQEKIVYYTEQGIRVVKERILDKSSYVRQMAIDGISSFIAAMKSHPAASVIKKGIDSERYLIRILKSRSYDEKLVVRRAILHCFREIIEASNTEPHRNFLELILERCRDISPSIRILAVKLLAHLIERFPSSVVISTQWLNNILPMINDPEQSVQASVSELIFEQLVAPLAGERGKFIFRDLMEQHHYDFLSNVFVVLKQNGYELTSLSKALYKITMQKEIHHSIWQILVHLSKATTYFKSDSFSQLWDKRYELPSQYYIVLANTGYTSPEVASSLIEDLNKAFTRPDYSFEMIRSMIMLLKNQKTDYSDSIYELISKAMEEVRSVVYSQSGDIIDKDLFSMTIFILGELFGLIDPALLKDFDLKCLLLLVKDKLLNNNAIPDSIRAIAITAIGKLCLVKRDFPTDILVQLLADPESCPEVKLNCLIVLSDLNIKYSALIDVQSLTLSFIDKFPIVRYQALHILTRLIVEDYLKLSPIIVFRLVFTLVDTSSFIKVFSRCCLFSVISKKHPQLLYQHFIDIVLYFTDEVPLSFKEKEDIHQKFSLNEFKRMKIYRMLILSMNETNLFKLIYDIFTRVIEKYIKGEYNQTKHSTILSDILQCTIIALDKLHLVTTTEVIIDDENRDQNAERGKIFFSKLKSTMISKILPLINSLYKILRQENSSLQKYIKLLYKRIVEHDKSITEELQATEPILAMEIASQLDIAAQNDDFEDTINTNITDYVSPILKRVRSTPISLLCSPIIKQDDHILATPLSSRSTKEFTTPMHQPNLDLSDSE